MKKILGEKGFTLIEMLVVVAIAAVVMGAASAAIVALYRISPQSNNWTVALRQVQNSGYWISRDVQMSAGNIAVGTGNTFLTMVLPQNPTDNVTIVYQLQNMSGGQRLMRTNQTTNDTIMIAEFISIPADTGPFYNSDNNTLTFTIKATYGNAPVTRTYEALQRVE